MGDSPLDYYNPLYDVHLRQYFASPHMQKHLRRMGLMHPSGKMGEDEVYARHHAMMDTMLKNREAQLMKMSELRRKLDAAEKVETCRRIRSGQSPESFRKSKPSRSLSRGPQGRNGTGSRQRRFSNSFEDKDEVVIMEQNYAPPESRRGRDAFQRLSANTKRFNYLHRMDDPTLLAYQENLRTQLDRLERFREVSFGVHSVARQPPVPHGSWFFRRRSLPSLTASAPASTLQEPLRSINNLRMRKHSSGARENLSRTSCPPPKRRDSASRLPPIANRGKSKSAAGATKPPASAPRLPPANASRGRSIVKKETTTTIKKTTVLPAVAAGGVALSVAATAMEVTAGREPSPELPPVEPTPPQEPERVPTPPGAPAKLDNEEIIQKPKETEKEETIPSPPGSERQANSPALRSKRSISEDESEPEYADSDKEGLAEQVEQAEQEYTSADEHQPDEHREVGQSPVAYEIPADEDQHIPQDLQQSPEPTEEQYEPEPEQESTTGDYQFSDDISRSPDSMEIHAHKTPEEFEAIPQLHKGEAYENAVDGLVHHSEHEEENHNFTQLNSESLSVSPVQRQFEEAEEEEHHISSRSAEESPRRPPDFVQLHEKTMADHSPIGSPKLAQHREDSVEIHEQSDTIAEAHQEISQSFEALEIPTEDALHLQETASMHSAANEIQAHREKSDEEQTHQDVSSAEDVAAVNHQSPPTSPESLEEQNETAREAVAFEVPADELVPSHQLSPPKTPEEDKEARPIVENLKPEADNSPYRSPVGEEITLTHKQEAEQSCSPSKSPVAEVATKSPEAFEVPAEELAGHHYHEETEDVQPTSPADEYITETPKSTEELEVSDEVPHEPEDLHQDSEPEAVVQLQAPFEAFEVAADELVHRAQSEEKERTSYEELSPERLSAFTAEHEPSEDFHEKSSLSSPVETTFLQNTEQVNTPPRSPEVAEDDEQIPGVQNHQELENSAYHHFSPRLLNAANEHQEFPKSSEAVEVPVDELVENQEEHKAEEHSENVQVYEIPSEQYVSDRYDEIVDQHHEEHNIGFHVVRPSVEIEPAEIAGQLSPNDELHQHVVITTTGPSPRPPHTDDEDDDERMSTDSVIIHGKDENPMTQSVYDISPTEYEHRYTLEDEVEDEEADDEEKEKWHKGEEVVNNNNDDQPKESSTTHTELASSLNRNEGKESVIDEAHNAS